jgi:hypothetical protein
MSTIKKRQREYAGVYEYEDEHKKARGDSLSETISEIIVNDTREPEREHNET